ncbi:MAG TPA: DUF370 domain-containing protein [Clostridiales bacterium]|nr:DUF370 domain-containing protein [Clostridiales bacterium]
MILHIGGDVVVPIKEIIAILDMETIKNSEINQEFMQISKDEGFIVDVSKDEVKSVVISQCKKHTVIYMSPISSTTLLKRSKFIEDISIIK